MPYKPVGRSAVVATEKLRVSEKLISRLMASMKTSNDEPLKSRFARDEDKRVLVRKPMSRGDVVRLAKIMQLHYIFLLKSGADMHYYGLNFSGFIYNMRKNRSIDHLEEANRYAPERTPREVITFPEVATELSALQKKYGRGVKALFALCAKEPEHEHYIHPRSLYDVKQKGSFCAIPDETRKSMLSFNTEQKGYNPKPSTYNYNFSYLVLAPRPWLQFRAQEFNGDSVMYEKLPSAGRHFRIQIFIGESDNLLWQSKPSCRHDLNAVTELLQDAFDRMKWLLGERSAKDELNALKLGNSLFV